MSTWYSNFLGSTSSRISNIQRTYFGGEGDGDTEDDTHVCRVLRSYYTEKGKPFPGWLPPDPKAPPPVTAVYTQPASQVGSRYGGLSQQPPAGNLSSLWDNNNNGPQQQQQEPQSLRRGGRGAVPASMMRNSDLARNSPFRNSDPIGGGGGGGAQDNNHLQARPLPSQRAGSYQNQAPYGSANSTPAPSTGGGSAQDRLRQRLFGGGTRTTSPAAGSGGPFNPPQSQSSSRGGGNSGDYEDRFAPGGMYDGSSSRGNDKPYMGANSPWSQTGEPDFSNYSGSGGGGGGGRTGGRRPGGLPSGPRPR
ncbi:Sec1-binding region of Mso1-domain-containing protein [Xylariaceae sp. FL0255]|nr:Sec1-binding region of Mso1-domain-containing protein [Xylariaceae sp. FL0255]